MSTNFKQFSGQLKAERDLILVVRFSSFKRDLIIELVRRVVRRTPVLTGLAKGNWQIGIGSAPTEMLAVFDTSGISTINAAIAKLQSVLPGVDVFFVNNVPYISFLEEGSSRQAAHGMLAVSIQELDIQFKSVA